MDMGSRKTFFFLIGGGHVTMFELSHIPSDSGCIRVTLSNDKIIYVTHVEMSGHQTFRTIFQIKVSLKHKSSSCQVTNCENCAAECKSLNPPGGSVVEVWGMLCGGHKNKHSS